jgi:hypothetical protein
LSYESNGKALTIGRVIEDLSEDTVDEYMAFCERALVGSANGKWRSLEITLADEQTTTCWSGIFLYG